VTEEQFTQFCHIGLTGDNELYRSIVEQLVSVDDFLVFKAMMVKRNAALGQEAVAALVVPPEPGVPETAEAGAESWEQAEQLEAQQKCVEAELQMAQALEMQLEQRLELMEELNKVLDLICTVYKLQAEVLAAEAAAEAAAAREAEQQEAMAVAQAVGNKAGLETIRLQPLASAPGMPGGGGPLPDVAALQIEAKKTEAAIQRKKARAKERTRTACAAQSAPCSCLPASMPQPSLSTA